MSRFSVCFALILASSQAVAGQLWLGVDVTTASADKKVHIEIPYDWMDVLNVENEGLEKEALDKVAEALVEGKSQQVIEVTQGEDHIVIAMHHRSIPKGAPSTVFYVKNEGAEKNMEVPLAMLVQMAPMAAAMSGQDGAIDIGKCLQKLGGMQPFTLIKVVAPGESMEIGVR